MTLNYDVTVICYEILCMACDCVRDKAWISSFIYIIWWILAQVQAIAFRTGCTFTLTFLTYQWFQCGHNDRYFTVTSCRRDMLVFCVWLHDNAMCMNLSKHILISSFDLESIRILGPILPGFDLSVLGQIQMSQGRMYMTRGLFWLCLRPEVKIKQ